jgi:uroporphyrinogen-III decarboxylase
VGDKVAVAFVTGTDFGTQRGPLIGCRTYRALFQPFHRRVNDWIHDHTPWKTFMHTCGSVADLIPDFVDAGFDVLNPLQFSAAGMDPKTLKDRFGDKLAFWGGGVDTQHTLPFGTPDDVRREVRRQVAAMHRAGGFVFSAVHNIQAGTPSENLIALFEAVRESRKLRSGGIPVLASSADPLQPHATC